MAWNTSKNPGDLIQSADYNSEVAWLNYRHRNWIDGQSTQPTLSQDNNGVERKFFKDDFSNDTSSQYTANGNTLVTWDTANKEVYGNGTPVYALMTSKTFDVSRKTHFSVRVDNANADNTKIRFVRFYSHYIDANNYIRITFSRDASASTGTFDIYKMVGGVGASVGSTSSGSYTGWHTVDISYDSTTGSVAGYLDGASLITGTITDSVFLTSAQIYAVLYGNGGNVKIEIADLTITPPIAYTDSCSADLTSRYQTIAGTAIAFASPGYNIIANTDSSYRLKSYQFKSGSRKWNFKLPASGTNGDYIYLQIAGTANPIVGTALGIGVGLIRAGGNHWNYATVVDGTVTDSTTDSTLVDGNTFYVEVEYSSEMGEYWYYIYATTKPTTPRTVFNATYPYGYVGVVVHSASGSKTFVINSVEIRANLLIGETNVPTSQTGLYFMPGGIGQFTQTGTWTFAGTTITCSGAGNLTAPFQTLIGVHTFTPTLANGTDYYYFSGYRVKFVASGGNTCNVTLQTAAGAGQGSGSLTVTTTAGLFGAPIIITETSNAITVTVAGATGSISSGTTTSTNAYPSWTVGTATCTFANYSFAGTRYYMTPMLRGAQIGSYWNGSTAVSCTRFCDDFNYDTHLEYTANASFTWDTANGFITTTTNLIAGTVNSVKCGSGHYKTRLYPIFSGATNLSPIVWCSQSQFTGDVYATAWQGYIVTFDTNSNTVYIYQHTAASTQAILASTSYTLTTGNIYDVEIYYNSTAGTVSLKVNGVVVIATVTDARLSTYPSGYTGFACYNTGGTYTFRLSSIVFNALEATATNGIAVTLGGVPHGARFDTQETATQTFTNAALAGEYILASKLKTTYPSGASMQYFFQDTTNGLSIQQDGDTVATPYPWSASAYVDQLIRLVLGEPNAGATITLQAQRYPYSGVSYDNQPAIFMKLMSLTPVWEV